MGLLAHKLDKLPSKKVELPVLDKPVATCDIKIPVPAMQKIQERFIELQPEAQNGTDVTGHVFCEGMYSRQYFLPKGHYAVSLMHAKQNFFVVIQGECIIAGEDGMIQVKAPFMTVTQPGTKRLIQALEDTVFVTFHPNPDNETDLVKLEQKFVVPESGVKRDLSIRHSNRKILA